MDIEKLRKTVKTLTDKKYKFTNQIVKELDELKVIYDDLGEFLKTFENFDEEFEAISEFWKL